MKRLLLAIALLWVALPSAHAEPVPVEVYGKLPSIESPRLSPDGQTMAFLSSVKGRRCLVIHKLDSQGPDAGRAVCPGNYEVRSFAWKNTDRLIVEVYTQGQSHGDELRTQSKLVALDLNGRNAVPLVEPANERAVDFGQDRVIDMLSDDPDHILIAAYRTESDSPDVVKVTIETGHRRTIVPAQYRITNWKTDGAGQVRVGVAVDDGMIKVYYRDNDDSPFRLIRQVPAADASKFAVLAIGREPGTLWVASTERTGYRAVYRYDVATDRLLDAYASVPGADIDSLVVDRGLPLGYGYTTDEPVMVYTDPSFRLDADQVAKALPQYRTTVVDSAADGRRLLVLAAGGNLPGSYFILTRAKSAASLEPLGGIRPDIPAAALAPVNPIAYRARDGLTIHGYVTLPPGRSLSDKTPIPFVVLPHGGPSTRDILGFDYLAQMIASRGYGVLQPNYRGSRGYGGDFEKAGFAQWGLKMQDDVTDGTQWLIDQKLADPRRICIVGWSYGGYTALMGAIKTPNLYRCAASMAGVTDLRRRLDRANQSRFADLNLPRFDSDPAIIDANSPVLHADRIRIPVFLAHGRRDFTVSVADSEAMEDALRQAGKQVETLYFDDDDHYLFREEDRIAFLKALEGFLSANLGAGFSGVSGATATN
ncbi:MAG TPA: S9 family peptidase [Alphaproteobacteria bacterium]|nr:S9 family peptidase [Alphaproteobacteria bacterium]